MFAGIVVAAMWILRPSLQAPRRNLAERKNLSDEDLRSVVSQMRLVHPPKTSTPHDKALVRLGVQFFFDPGFSVTGTVACATCHQPDKSFTDGLTTAKGLTTTSMNTPTLINTYAGEWFFWNGRADSLEAQAMGPVENPKEHGFSRIKVLHRIGSFYKAEYETIFGALPQLRPDAATPNPPASLPLVSHQVAAYALGTLGSSSLQKST